MWACFLYEFVFLYVGLPPTPARGFHPDPHNAHALFVLRLRRLEEHVLNRRKATLSREHKSLSTNPASERMYIPSEETLSSWVWFLF